MTMIKYSAMTALILAVSACSGDKGESHDHAATPLETSPAGVTAKTIVMGVSGDAIGEAMMTDGPHGMILRIDVNGLSEGFHGIHLHKIGDCSDHEGGFKKSGSHINTDLNEHGLLNARGFEVADLPNVYAHHTGHARAELFIAGLSAADALDTDGFAVVVHQNQDDHQTQPIGGAGPRLGCAAFTR